MVYRHNYRYVFWKFFYVSVYISSKSGIYITKLPNFRKGVELLPPPVPWSPKKYGMNRVNNHLLSQCKNTAWFDLESSVVAKTYPKDSKKQH